MSMQLRAVATRPFSQPLRAGSRLPATQGPGESYRPDPAADFIRQAVPGGKPEELAFFYRMGRQLGQDDQLLEKSLQGLQQWIAEPWKEGPLARMSRPERVAVLERLVVSSPPEKKEYVLCHSDVTRPLGLLEDWVVECNHDAPNNMAHLGPNETIEFASSAPDQRLDIHQGLEAYFGYLDRILHAAGRTNPTKQLNEDLDAVKCLWIEQNVLHGETREVERFKELVSFYHSPWPALAVLQQARLVPEEKQGQFLELLAGRVQENRERNGGPENSQDHAREGDFVGGMSKYLGLVLRAQRPGESLARVDDDLREARTELKGMVAKWLPREALDEAVSMRGEQDDLRSATRRLQANFDVLQQLFPAQDTRTQLKLAGELGRQDPERADQLQACADYLGRLNPPREQVLPALQAAYAAQGSPLDALRKTFRSLELTGSMEGLDEVAREIQAGLADGRLSGSAEQLMDRFVERLESLNLVHDDHRVSFETARQEFFEGSRGKAMGMQGGVLLVGGVRMTPKARG